MAKITWLGEDNLHATTDSEGQAQEGAGPSWTTWRGHRFDKGKPVEITDNEIIGKAKGNPYFKVEGGPGRPAGSTRVGLHKDDEEVAAEPESEEAAHEPVDPAPRRFRR